MGNFFIKPLTKQRYVKNQYAENGEFQWLGGATWVKVGRSNSDSIRFEDRRLMSISKFDDPTNGAIAADRMGQKFVFSEEKREWYEWPMKDGKWKLATPDQLNGATILPLYPPEGWTANKGRYVFGRIPKKEDHHDAEQKDETAITHSHQTSLSVSMKNKQQWFDTDEHEWITRDPGSCLRRIQLDFPEGEVTVIDKEAKYGEESKFHLRVDSEIGIPMFVNKLKSVPFFSNPTLSRPVAENSIAFTVPGVHNNSRK